MFGVLDYLKIGAGIAAGVLITSLYWTGLPILNDYPILKNIPLLGDIAVGHAQTVKDDALKGYVLESEKTAAEDKAVEMERQRNAYAQSYEELRKRAAAADQSKDQKNAKLKKSIAGDTGNDGAVWTDGDIEWLQNH
ncbi:hypothetical protein [Rhizobium leucaenae]|uniref:hypothetical protein n=1 Tax=Rhizobium leucaenae TaxID=29450 RepID=UPI0007EE722B|nr:hypothetical protein [Rhizobium leucaenae]